MSNPNLGRNVPHPVLSVYERKRTKKKRNCYYEINMEELLIKKIKQENYIHITTDSPAFGLQKFEFRTGWRDFECFFDPLFWNHKKNISNKTLLKIRCNDVLPANTKVLLLKQSTIFFERLRKLSSCFSNALKVLLLQPNSCSFSMACSAPSTSPRIKQHSVKLLYTSDGCSNFVLEFMTLINKFFAA